jgi:prolyl oligopeptidase
VPYFLVSHKHMPLDGSTATLLYGYGGFEISLPPTYSGVVGAGWLDTTTDDSEGGTYMRIRYYVGSGRDRCEPGV